MPDIYHICREHDIGDLSKGYIGIGNARERIRRHKAGCTNQHVKNAYAKYDDVTEYVVSSGSMAYCQLLEILWRPLKAMGWNCMEGGGIPPNHTGKRRSPEVRAKMSESLKGKGSFQHTPLAKRLIGESTSKRNNNLPIVECPHYNKLGQSTAMQRWHFDNCKYKES